MLLQNIFGERIISRKSNFNWPLHLQDIIAPDFFLCGYTKEHVYISKPETIHKGMENALKRVKLCEAQNGYHLKDLIFYVN